jgi:hypothetical protein
MSGFRDQDTLFEIDCAAGHRTYVSVDDARRSRSIRCRVCGATFSIRFPGDVDQKFREAERNERSVRAAKSSY